MSWSERAACTPEDRSFFYPEGSPSVRAVQTRAAKRICRTCPVASECLEYSLVNEAYGTWGGLTEVEREVERMNRGMFPQLPARFHQKNSTLRNYHAGHSG